MNMGKKLRLDLLQYITILPVFCGIIQPPPI